MSIILTGRRNGVGVITWIALIFVVILLTGCHQPAAEPNQFGGTVTVGPSLKVLSTNPPSPAVLRVGEKFSVKFRYKLGETESAQIWVRPYTNGSSTRGYKAHGSGVYSKSTREDGIGEGWFYFDEPVVVDEVCLNMRDSTAKENVMVVFYKLAARWVDDSGEKQPKPPAR